MCSTSLADFTVSSIFLSVLILSTFTFWPAAESAAVGGRGTDSNRVVYRRFTRRRPAISADYSYVDEYMEIFETNMKPPGIFLPMTDEEVDKFIFCDFHRELEECKKYWNSRKSMRTSGTGKTTAKPSNVRPTINPSFYTTQSTIDRITSTTSKPTTERTSVAPTKTTTTAAPTRPTTPVATKTTTTTSTTTTTTTSTTTTTTSAPMDDFGRIPNIEENNNEDTWSNDDEWDEFDENNDDEEDYTDQVTEKTEKPETTEKTETKPFFFFR